MSKYNKIIRMAKNDSLEWKMSQLLMDDIAWKSEHVKGYREAMTRAWDNLDLGVEEKLYEQSRRRLIKKGFTDIPTKGRPVSKGTVIGVAAATAVIMHKTGYDKVLMRKYKAFLIKQYQNSPGAQEHARKARNA